MSLTDFLLARITEDEDAAPFVFAEQYTPARVLAECSAKRAVVEAAWHDHSQIEGEWGSGKSRKEMDAIGDAPASVAILAAVYADHRDYRDEWRP